MFLKVSINKDLESKINFTDHDIYNQCPYCHKEFKIHPINLETYNEWLGSNDGKFIAYDSYIVSRCLHCGYKWYEKNLPDGSVTYVHCPEKPLSPMMPYTSAQQFTLSY